MYRIGATGQEAGYGTTFTRRGNITATKVWRNLPTGDWLTTALAYDTLGNVVRATDPRQRATNIGYDDTCGTGPLYTYAFPTSVTNRLYWSNTACYDRYLGRATSYVEASGVERRVEYDAADGLDRVSKVTTGYGLGGDKQRETHFSYTDTPLAVKVETRSDRLVTGDALGANGLYSGVEYDGLGRPTRTTQTDDQGNIQTRTDYDALSRKKTVTNPYRTVELGATTYSYDGLGRLTLVAQPDGSISWNTYQGMATQVYDEQVKRRDFRHDALGRLTQVTEDPAGLNYITSYNYSPTGDLVDVRQGAQNRHFVYDTAGCGARPTRRAAQPNTGTITTAT